MIDTLTCVIPLIILHLLIFHNNDMLKEVKEALKY